MDKLKSQIPIRNLKSAGNFEKLLALLGLVVSMAATVLLWINLSPIQGMWPLPGFYFVEMVVVSAVVAGMCITSHPWRLVFTWIATGIFLAFTILGIESIFFFFLPVLLILGLLAILGDIRSGRNSWLHLVAFLITGLLQAGIMLSVIKLIG